MVKISNSDFFQHLFPFSMEINHSNFVKNYNLIEILCYVIVYYQIKTNLHS